jgi:hypothetical protein
MPRKLATLISMERYAALVAAKRKPLVAGN